MGKLALKSPSRHNCFTRVLSVGFIFLPPYEVALDVIPFSTLVQEVSSFVKRMMLTLRPFSEEHLVGTNSSIGPSLMKRILNGGAHQTTITMGGPGIGDIGMKNRMILHLSLRVQNQIWFQTGWPSD